MAQKKGFDSDKRWGNSAQEGFGANSPAMMEARAKFGKKQSTPRSEEISRDRKEARQWHRSSRQEAYHKKGGCSTCSK